MVVHRITTGNLIKSGHFKRGMELKEVNEWYSIIYMPPSLFDQSPNERHLGYFHFLAVRKRAAMNINVQVFA